MVGHFSCAAEYGSFCLTQGTGSLLAKKSVCSPLSAAVLRGMPSAWVPTYLGIYWPPSLNYQKALFCYTRLSP